MRYSALVIAMASLGLGPAALACPPGSPPPVSVEFEGMPAPASTDEKTDIYTAAKLRMTCADGTKVEYPLQYRQLFATTDMLGDAMVGGLFDVAGKPLADKDGQMASDGPDGTSLMQVDGLAVPGAAGNPLAMITQFEYKDLPPAGASSDKGFWSKLPPAVGLTLLDQDPTTGALTPKSYRNIDFAPVQGGWIHCGSTLSDWGTHLGSEEYEPDARVWGGGPAAKDTDDRTDIASFSAFYFGKPDQANPYRYGLVPEIAVKPDGTTTLVKHYAPGRYAREMLIVGADRRTAIGGDDGKNTGLFMFVADREADLSAGTLYAAKVGPQGESGFALGWIPLGHATDAEIAALVDAGIRFADIFDASLSEPEDQGFKKVVTYNGTEWLRLRTGNSLMMSPEAIAQAAAFLETRRLAAYLGATTEFSKMEYIAFNPRDRRFYITISRVESGMADEAGDLRMPANHAGLILELDTAAGQQDTSGKPIASELVGTTLSVMGKLVGGALKEKDAEGNLCAMDQICGPDNLVYVDSIRTLFIGEDTDKRNNNFVWAYSLDTERLARILSVPLGAEATGLMVAPNYGGHAYLMSNFQHPGDKVAKTYEGADQAEALAKIDSKWGNRKRAAIGYIGTVQGALPALR